MFLHHAGVHGLDRGPVKEGPRCGRRHGRGSSRLREVFVCELFYIHVYAMPEQKFKRQAPSSGPEAAAHICTHLHPKRE